MPQRPFMTCGIDYSGPYYLIDKLHGRITNSFLNSLFQFVSRREKGQKIYRGNGTNFVEACNELRELGELLTSHDFKGDIIDLLENEKIFSLMIPLDSPQFGEVWEAAVKPTKNTLSRGMSDFPTLISHLNRSS